MTAVHVLSAAQAAVASMDDMVPSALLHEYVLKADVLTGSSRQTMVGPPGEGDGLADT